MGVTGSVWVAVVMRKTGKTNLYITITVVYCQYKFVRGPDVRACPAASGNLVFNCLYYFVIYGKVRAGLAVRQTNGR